MSPKLDVTAELSVDRPQDASADPVALTRLAPTDADMMPLVVASAG
ncbi:hypothetical protein JCM15831A_02700 [Asaia astilbis]